MERDEGGCEANPKGVRGDSVQGKKRDAKRRDGQIESGFRRDACGRLPRSLGAERKLSPSETTGLDAAPRLGSGGMGLVDPRAAPIFTGTATQASPYRLCANGLECT